LNTRSEQQKIRYAKIIPPTLKYSTAYEDDYILEIKLRKRQKAEGEAANFST
jgi:hypothetical protein